MPFRPTSIDIELKSILNFQDALSNSCSGKITKKEDKSYKWCWESLVSFNSVCVKTNYWRSLDIYLLLSFPPEDGNWQAWVQTRHQVWAEVLVRLPYSPLLVMVSSEGPQEVSVQAGPPASLNLAPESFSYLMSPISLNPPHK